MIPEKQVLWLPKRIKVDFCEHFVNMPTASSAYGGALSLQVVQTGSLSIANSDATHPGVATLSTGTGSSTGRCALCTNLNAFLLGGISFEIEFAFKIAALSNSTDSFAFFIGITDQNSVAIPNNAVGLYYTQGQSSFNYYVRKSAGTASTAVGITADTNWHILNIKINKAGTSATFMIDSANAQTISINIPNTAKTGLGMGVYKSAGTTASGALWIDYVYLKLDAS